MTSTPSSFSRTLAAELLNLPHSYQGPQKPLTAPYAVLGLGQAHAAQQLMGLLVTRTLAQEGTQIILESPETAAEAKDYAALAELSGAAVVRAGFLQPGRPHTGLDFLAPAGVLATYHLAQYAAYVTGHSAEALQAETLLGELAKRCHPDEENNPARALAWTLWSRTALLFADSEYQGLLGIWQGLLARVGKSLSIVVADEPLLVVTGAFEGQRERGDEKVALLLGETTPELELVREILQSRIDEVVDVPFVDGSDGYAGSLALWYFGVWTAYYLAERHAAANQNTTAEDSPALREVLRVLSGEDDDKGSNLEA